MMEENKHNTPEENSPRKAGDKADFSSGDHTKSSPQQTQNPQSRYAQQKQRGEIPDTPPSPFLSDKKEEALRGDVQRILKESQLPEQRAPEKPSPGDAQTKSQRTPKESVQNTHTQPSPSTGLPQARSHQKQPEEAGAPERTTPTSANIEGKRKNEEGGEQGEPTSSPVTSLRTFKHDVQKMVQSKKMSLTKAATLEEEKRRKQGAESFKADQRVKSRTQKRMMSIVFAIVVLFLLGGLAIFAISIIQSQRTQQESSSVSESSFLFSEQTFTFPLVGQPRQLLLELSRARTSANLTLGAITRIVPTISETNPATGEKSERAATVSEFFNAIDARIPGALLRTFADDFFLGIHTIDENVPFLVIPITSYERAFAGMLEWESIINTDLAPFFTQVRRQLETQNGSVSIRDFEDVIIRNFDVRALRDQSGEIQMLYAFPTREVLIIAESPHSFVEALSRLRAERRL